MAFENQAKLYCWQITRATFVLVPFDSALEIVPNTDVKCITKQQYSSDVWPLSLKIKRNCIVHKSLKIIKLIVKLIGASLSEPHSLVAHRAQAQCIMVRSFVVRTYVYVRTYKGARQNYLYKFILTF
jgi:hypothetical protein